MARVTHVKKAQPRYKMVPDLDENGNQKVVAIMTKSGNQKTNKHGRATVRRLTVPDKTQPLPNRKCDKCGTEIKPGDPYKWIAPKSGPYGGSKRYRCGTCPTWHVWEYSHSLSARISEIQYNAEQDQPTEADVDDMSTYLSGVADSIRELAEEKRESAQSIEDGFGHETYLSSELNETADNLESWADDIENTDLPEVPEPCLEHDEDNPDEDCEQCTEREQFDEDTWLADAVAEIDNCPV